MGYHGGGIVGQGGTTSDDVLAILQRGEGVVDRGRMASGGATTMTFNGPIHLEVKNGTAREIREELLKLKQRVGSLGLS